jgi:SHS2 domain-containing protein
MCAVYRWLDHTGELALEIEAGDERGVFEQALEAVFELTEGDSREGANCGGGETNERLTEPTKLREIEAAAPDRAALLAAWLEELFFLAETEGLVPIRLVRLELAGERLTAAVETRPGRPRHLVKAVTYHGLKLERVGERWRAHAVLDV